MAMLPAHTMHLLLAVMLPLASVHLSCALVVAAASDSDSASASVSAALSGSSSRHKRESRVVDLTALKDNLASIEDNLSDFQKRSCAVGLNSHHCAIAHLDDVMQGTDYLSGGFSPGKRDAELPDDVRSQAEILLQNLSEQKQAVKTLRSLLSKLGARAEQQAKRTCAFRLGNHCLTEALDHAANQYYYLQSPASPGRRRRQAEQEQGGRLRLRRRADSQGQTKQRQQQQHQQQQQQRRLFQTQRRR